MIFDKNWAIFEKTEPHLRKKLSLPEGRAPSNLQKSAQKKSLVYVCSCSLDGGRRRVLKEGFLSFFRMKGLEA